MWPHDLHLKQQYVIDRQRRLMADGERSRVRRAIRRPDERTVHRPTKTR